MHVEVDIYSFYLSIFLIHILCNCRYNLQEKSGPVQANVSSVLVHPKKETPVVSQPKQEQPEVQEPKEMKETIIEKGILV